MTLDKILQSQGFGSRKQCQALIRAGRVTVAGDSCLDPQRDFAVSGLRFAVDGDVHDYRAQVYLALNKPVGFECSRQPQHHRSVFSLLPSCLQQRSVQPVGRLDQDTSGLLLLSDDGAFNHALASPKRHVAKTYLVQTARPVSDDLLMQLRTGVKLRDESDLLAAVAADTVDEYHLRLTITQGKYHQVKRMVAAAGNHVAALRREAIGGLALGVLPLPSLPEGAWCYLDEHALRCLQG